MEPNTEPDIDTGHRRLTLPPALQYPAYRAYWLGMLASVSGFQMFRAAQGWFVYELTGSPLFLGYALTANAVPAIFFNLVAGGFAGLGQWLMAVETLRQLIPLRPRSGYSRHL